MISDLVGFIREHYETNDFIPLHAPAFDNLEKELLNDVIDSTFVSSVGAYVPKFESIIEQFTGCKKAVAVVNGTAGLHAALHLSGVQNGDLVITQALTFVATCNAIVLAKAEPVFVDICDVSLSLCPKRLSLFLEEQAFIDEQGNCKHLKSGRTIKAVLPMHTFGHPAQLDEIEQVCQRWNLVLIEDAAESLGSYYKGNHTGLKGTYSVVSFNGNKIITTGGGGAILCNQGSQPEVAKHVTTTAKLSHPFEFNHDQMGFNYRMPNLNAALGCAQFAKLEAYIKDKRDLAEKYEEFFKDTDFKFFKEPDYAKSNYWLNAIICPDRASRDSLLENTNNAGVMTRPVWKTMTELPMYRNCLQDTLENTHYFSERIVNLPSSPK